MMPKRSLDPKEIIRLLSKLKSETPEYPADLLEARKAAFLKQAATLKIEGKGEGGEGGQEGGSGGGSGPALGGGTAAQGIVLQALVGFSVIAALLLTAFAYREQIGEILRNRNEVVAIVESETVAALSTDTATVTPGWTGSPTAPTATPTGPAMLVVNLEDITIVDGTVYVDGTPVIDVTLIVDGTPVVVSTVIIDGVPVVVVSPTDPKTNPGLHLGQTPGAPAAPGQGNPGNVNQPEKTDRPDNPNKPDKPTQAPKEDKPTKEK